MSTLFSVPMITVSWAGSPDSTSNWASHNFGIAEVTIQLVDVPRSQFMIPKAS